MRVAVILLVVTSLSLVLGKTNVKSLTESHGQEIIELGAPIKDLPPGLDEEPAPDDDDDKPPATILVTTRKDIKKTTASTTTTHSPRTTQEVIDDEEARIEKELAAIYKDNDYKSEGSDEKTDKPSENDEEKLIARQQTNNNLKFQPNSNKKQDIEAFRTSVDDIDCGKVTQMLMAEQKSDGELIAANYIVNSCILLVTCIPYM